MAVMFSTTAPTPDAATPPRPVTFSTCTTPGPTAPPPAAWPSTVASPGRVSSSRAGVTARNAVDDGVATAKVVAVVNSVWLPRSSKQSILIA